MKKFGLLSVMSALVFGRTLCAGAIDSQAREDQELRIRELIPESWLELPAIDPALPDHYVAFEPEFSTRLFWGTPEDLAVLARGEFSVKSELISLCYSPHVIQSGSDGFHGEKEMRRDLQLAGFTEIKLNTLKWGVHPVLVQEAKAPGGQIVRLAWVGMNAPNGLTILFQHHPPMHRSECCTVWNDLIYKSTALPEYDTFRVHGLTMKDGYSMYRHGAAHLKVTVEKRHRDQLLATMVEPISPKTTFQLQQVVQTQMRSQWNYGTPCARVCGVVTEKSGKYGTCTADCVIDVLTKDVEEFSFDLDLSHHRKGVLIQTRQAF